MYRKEELRKEEEEYEGYEGKRKKSSYEGTKKMKWKVEK
jgi:hypothetical protein